MEPRYIGLLTLYEIVAKKGYRPNPKKFTKKMATLNHRINGQRSLPENPQSQVLVPVNTAQQYIRDLDNQQLIRRGNVSTLLEELKPYEVMRQPDYAKLKSDLGKVTPGPASLLFDAVNICKKKGI